MTKRLIVKTISLFDFYKKLLYNIYVIKNKE